MLQRDVPAGTLRRRGSAATSSSSCFPAPTPTRRSRRPSRLRRELGDGPRRGRLPAAAERRDLDLSLRRRGGDAAAARRRPGALPAPRRAARTRSSASARSVRGASPTELPPARSDRSRSGSGADGSALVGAMDAAAAIWAEQTVADVLERLGKAIAFVVGATATNISQGRRAAARRHDASTRCGTSTSVRTTSYLIADYPVTQEVLETATACGRSRSSTTSSTAARHSSCASCR